MNIPKTFKELRIDCIIFMCLYGFIAVFMMGMAVIFAMTDPMAQIPLVYTSILCSTVSLIGMVKAMGRLLIKI